MIAHVAGEIVEKSDNALIIDVQGLGYEIQVAGGDFSDATLGEHIKLYTHDHLRENAHELFGFSQLSAKKLFQLLIGVSGVGPKMALAILSLGDTNATRGAIAAGDSAYIQRASGVGKRIAERIAVDLKDKVGLVTHGPLGLVTPTNNDDAADALLALGYSLQQVNEALQSIDNSLTPQVRIKQALQYLGGQ